MVLSNWGKGYWDSLRRAIREYVAHYNQERLHQGIGNERIERTVSPRSTSLRNVVANERLGGLFRSYRASAA